MKPIQYIIAIGASAGGLEEINSFFDHTPADQVSYVIIQHLSPDFKSHMVELLGRHSKLQVKEAEDGMKIISNEVYLIPHDQFMTIKDGAFHLTPKVKGNTPNLTINTFFKSLAEYAGSKAIAIIFSGMGSDGTEGIKMIKKAGGMVMARPAETSEFGSMPSHAIATGLVDFILEPQAMPEAIEEYIEYGMENLPDNQSDEIHLNIIVNIIKNHNSNDFSDYKKSTLLRRAKRRAFQLEYSSLNSYIEFLKTDPKEIDALSKDFLISVTSFFRDKEAFQFLADSVFPDILKGLKEKEEIKIWVAGCATGEEVYSLGILMAEAQIQAQSSHPVKIFATDIDESALAFAGKGLYPGGISKNIDITYLNRYFNAEGSHYRIKPEIRKMVIFARHDLVKNPPYCNMNFISCRNLLIYMTPVLQKKIFAMILFGLRKNGYLFLGSSENPVSILQNLEVVAKKWKIFKNLSTEKAVRFNAFTLPEIKDIKPQGSMVIKQEVFPNSGLLSESIIETLVKESEILIICENLTKKVVKAYGNTTKILLQKNFNLNLPELLPQHLAMAFNILCSELEKTHKPATLNKIDISDNPKDGTVSLKISPIFQGNKEFYWLLVRIMEDQEEKDLLVKRVFVDKEINKEYCLNLEEEVRNLKEKLNLTNEQLNTSYENLQSFNEELLSANEEMQSANEEMQSVNEELDNVNNNFQINNKELMELNDDLNNYFRSNLNGQLFVNNELKLMRFSPISTELINLRESDIGRPISHISTNFKWENLVEDLKEVISKGSVIVKEIQTNDGRWFQINVMPYVQQSNQKNMGAIVTFSDISQLKKTQIELDTNNKSLMRINADLDNFVLSAAHDLLSPLGNIEMTINVINMIEVKDPELAHFLEIINLSVVKFRNLIKDMATIVKLESDIKQMEFLDIDEIINNIEWSLANKIKESGAIIRRNLRVEKIMYSKKNLRSILFNLVSNSIKFKGEKKPIIYITTQKEEEYIRFILEDNGIGMSPEGINRIFDIYGRLHQDVEGLGIGLYLARKIIHASGGEIQVESELGKGSKFTISLKEIPDLD
jgi:two-component system CheB/CheR fusion protein